MNKQEFMEQLSTRLSGLPHNDIEERLNFYSEMIDDRMEEGLSEQEAVSLAGPIDEIVSQTLEEIPFLKIAKEGIRPKRQMKTWEIVLLALGSPIWLSLAIAAFAVIFSLFVTVWAVIIAFWSVFVAFLVCVLSFVVAGVVCAVFNHIAAGVALIGAGLVMAGLSILAFFGCIGATKGIIILTKKFLLWTKNCIIKKEEL